MLKHLLLLCGLATAHPLTAQLVTTALRINQHAGHDTVLHFVVPEGESQQVLMRVAGPALGAFGLTALQDPALELFRGGVLLGSNDNWGADNADALRQAFLQVGAFQFLNNSRDAALLATLAPGDYTLRSYSVDTGGGMILPELYSVTGAGFSGLSVSTYVEEDSLHLGVLAAPGTYLLRSRSSSIHGAGNAHLQNYESAAQNDTWTSSADAAAILAAGAQLGLPPLGDLDAALLVETLRTGALNVIASNRGTPDLVSLDLSFVPPPVGVPVPEPGTYGLGAVGLALALMARRARRQRPSA